MTIEPKAGEQYITLNEGRADERKVKVLKRQPKGWTPIKGAMTAPRGYVWVSNNKSIFGGKREHALMKIKDYPEDPDIKKVKTMPKAKPSEPKKAVTPQKTVNPAAVKKGMENSKAKKAKLAGEVYDLMMLEHTPEQRKRMPSRESFIEAQFKTMRIGGRTFKPATVKELNARKAELEKKFPQKNNNKSAELAAAKLTEKKPEQIKASPVKPVSPKPSKLSGKNSSAPKLEAKKRELKRVGNPGGFTVWDGEPTRTGKTFGTEEEAKAYAANLLKETGKAADIEKTTKRVTHTFNPVKKVRKK